MISQIQFLLLFPLLLSTTVSAVPNRIDVLIKFFAKLGPEEMDHTIQICDEYEENAFKIAHKYFKKADKNGDGRVDHKEMGNVVDKNFMEKFRDEYSIKQPHFDLTQFVNDVEGVESEKLAKKMLEKAIEAMKGKKHDDTTGTLLFLFISNILKKNEDGSIGEEQFLNRPKFCALLKRLVELADANGDGNGKADRQEMLALLKGAGKLDQQKLELQLLLDTMENGGHEEL